MSASVRKITPDDGFHYFFGYYDLCPYDSGGSRHLAHRVEFADRLPRPDDRAELGYLEEGRFFPFAKTSAWNFQQGSLLRWAPRLHNGVIFNTRESRGFCTALLNLHTSKTAYTDRAAACVSPDGLYGLSINFSRVFDFRPGYGYAGITDPFANEPCPPDDGVFLTDLQTGKSRLLISLKRISEEFPSPVVRGDKLTVNHITFSPDSRRFLLLVRNTPKPGGSWKTMLITSDLEGSLRRVFDYTLFSHYWWRDKGSILAYCRCGEKTGVWLFEDAPDVSEEKGTARAVVSPCFESDLHCSFSPDGHYILGDGYPDCDGYRPLYLYDTKTGTERLLLRSYSPNPNPIDIRCDLHARFHPGGKKVSFDTLYKDMRCICEADIDI